MMKVKEIVKELKFFERNKRPVNFTIPEYISTNFDEAEKAYRGAKSF